MSDSSRNQRRVAVRAGQSVAQMFFRDMQNPKNRGENFTWPDSLADMSANIADFTLGMCYPGQLPVNIDQLRRIASEAARRETQRLIAEMETV